MHPPAPPRKTAQPRPPRLEDIPNIGKSIAADLRRIGILAPQQLTAREPLEIYLALSAPMGRRHDPCVLYTLMAARHFLESGVALPWWKFTAQGKKLLAARSASASRLEQASRLPAPARRV